MAHDPNHYEEDVLGVSVAYDVPRRGQQWEVVIVGTDQVLMIDSPSLRAMRKILQNRVREEIL